MIVYNRKKIEKNASAYNSYFEEIKCTAWEIFWSWGHFVKFFIQCHDANFCVSGLMLMEKAKEIALKLDVKDAFFPAGWLHNFKLRHEISCKMISGEAKDVPQKSV